MLIQTQTPVTTDVLTDDSYCVSHIASFKYANTDCEFDAEVYRIDEQTVIAYFDVDEKCCLHLLTAVSLAAANETIFKSAAFESETA